MISDQKLERENKLKGLKRRYQTNKNAIIGIFNDYFMKMMVHPKTMNRKLEIILTRIKRIRSIIRSNRTRERKKIHAKLNYPLK